MNLAFLLVWAICVIGCIAIGFIIEDVEMAFPVFVLVIVGLLASMLFPIGTTTREETTSFRVERTPYRLVITACNKERTYTDAYTLSLGNPKVVKHAIAHNAWGIELDRFSTIEPVFPTP